MTASTRDGVRPGAVVTKPTRRLDIQGMRAVAVLMVVAYHAGLPLPGGFIGVDVFFVISGFVITAMLQREWDKHGRIRFGAFYLRRFKRLTPALTLTVAVTLAVGALLLSPLGTQQTAAQTGLGAILLSANLVIARTTGGYFDAPAETNPLLNMWSLSVEEQFYLAFPLLLASGWALVRRGSSNRTPYVIVTGVGVASFALAIIGSIGVTPSASWMTVLQNVLLGFYSPLTRAWEFAAGALLALALHRGLQFTRTWVLTLGVAGSILLAVSLSIISGATPFPGVWTLLPVAGTLGLLVAGSGDPNAVSRALSSPPMTRIGDWSYSIYLWHWPMIVFARILWDGQPAPIVAAALLSIIPAYVSYRWVEEPIRAMPLPSRPRVAKLVALTVLPPVAVASALLVAAAQGFWLPAVKMYQSAAIAHHYGADSGCHSYEPLSDAQRANCTWNDGLQGAPVYLLGDSHADHISEAVVTAGQGRPVVVSTTPNCPFTAGYLERPASAAYLNDGCRADLKESLRYLQTAEPGTVVLAAADGYWRDQKTIFGLSQETATADPQQKLNAWSSSLTSTVEILKAAGHTVVLVQAVPSRTGDYAWNPASCSLLDLMSSPVGCGKDMPLAWAESQQGTSRDVLARVAENTGARLVDPGPTMCPEAICTIDADGFVRLRDTVHISVGQSRALAPLFESAIQDSPR